VGTAGERHADADAAITVLIFASPLLPPFAFRRRHYFDVTPCLIFHAIEFFRACCRYIAIRCRYCLLRRLLPRRFRQRYASAAATPCHTRQRAYAARYATIFHAAAIAAAALSRLI